MTANKSPEKLAEPVKPWAQYFEAGKRAMKNGLDAKATAYLLASLVQAFEAFSMDVIRRLDRYDSAEILRAILHQVETIRIHEETRHRVPPKA